MATYNHVLPIQLYSGSKRSLNVHCRVSQVKLLLVQCDYHQFSNVERRDEFIFGSGHPKSRMNDLNFWLERDEKQVIKEERWRSTSSGSETSVVRSSCVYKSVGYFVSTCFPSNRHYQFLLWRQPLSSCSFVLLVVSMLIIFNRFQSLWIRFCFIWFVFWVWEEDSRCDSFNFNLNSYVVWINYYSWTSVTIPINLHA